MIKQTRFIRLLEILNRILRNPLMKDVTLEQVVLYCVDFIHIFGFPEIYINKEDTVNINGYRGELPCDLISINQVMDTLNGICLSYMTSTFLPNNKCDVRNPYEQTYKVLNHVIFTSLKEGTLKISYLAIPVDDNGYPLIPDDPVYHRALEAFVKVEVFTLLFELGKIRGDVLSHAEQQYAWRAGLLTSQYNIPSVDQMEALCRSWVTLILRTNQFENGFKNLGDKEHIRIH